MLKQQSQATGSKLPSASVNDLSRQAGETFDRRYQAITGTGAASG